MGLPVVVLALLAVVAASCGTSKKAKILTREIVTAKITPTDYKTDTTNIAKRLEQNDTIRIVDKNNEEQTIMAYRSTSGDVFGEAVLDAIIVEATFKNVAERNGKVDLSFQVTVPQTMQDSKWQVRFLPTMNVLGESHELEPVFITGTAYRKAQLKGYQQYERFLSKIISDTSVFINVNMLEIFLQRNIPQIYAYKTDSTKVSDDVFYSHYGVSEQQAVTHYTNKLAKKRNENRKKKRASKFAKYVKQPILDDGIRLDTVIMNTDGDFVYTYVQTLNTRPGLKKAEISLIGKVYEEDEIVYTTPVIGPLDFYISSISSFADNLTTRYKTKVIERRATDNKEYKIDFSAGRSELDLELNSNGEEITKVRKHLGSLIENQVYDLDSIIVSASASPDGAYNTNKRLAHQRSVSLVDYFKNYVKHYKDSLSDDIVDVNLDTTFIDQTQVKILFTPRSIPEDWDGLRTLIENDTLISDKEKESIYMMYDIEDDDAREMKLRTSASFQYIRKELYPQLRSVKFKFYMHRKGMIKDTVHTTIIDTTYMDGVQALKDMDYKKALSLLDGYKDYNTAVAYTSMNMNASALSILSNLEKSAQVNYLLAIINAREGKVQDAVRYYMESCRQNPSYIHRGNLDPEISELIKTYKLHDILEREFESEFGY